MSLLGSETMELSCRRFASQRQETGHRVPTAICVSERRTLESEGVELSPQPAKSPSSPAHVPVCAMVPGKVEVMEVTTQIPYVWFSTALAFFSKKLGLESSCVIVPQVRTTSDMEHVAFCHWRVGITRLAKKHEEWICKGFLSETQKR